jgi:hypothetical protein
MCALFPSLSTIAQTYAQYPNELPDWPLGNKRFHFIFHQVSMSDGSRASVSKDCEAWVAWLHIEHTRAVCLTRTPIYISIYVYIHARADNRHGC